MISRLLSSLTAASLCFSIMTPAFAAAATTDEVLAELASFKPETMCAGRTDSNLGRCIGDVIKRIAAMHKEFTEALRTERDVWYGENGNLGLSTEYYIQLQTYLAGVKQKRTAFTDLQRSLEKTFFAARKQVLENAQKVTEAPTRTITAVDMDGAKAKCATQTNDTALRVCLRQQLRLLSPKTR